MRYLPDRSRLRPSWGFLAMWLAITVLAALALARAGLAPQGVIEMVNRLAAIGQRAGEAPPAASTPHALRPRIIIPDISANAPIVFPKSADLDTLNMALAEGVVHYPGSAMPGEQGNVFLFGHSTGLAVVANRAYTALNRLAEVKAGGVIRIRHAGREHWYRVTAVTSVKADAATVALDASGPPRLTLSTCNVFGAVDDRTVVEADFAGSYPLWSYSSRAGSSS